MALRLIPGFDLSTFSSFGIGGQARWAAEVVNSDDLAEAFDWAGRNGTPALLVGEGTNILFSDRGFDGLLLISRMGGIARVAPPAGSGLGLEGVRCGSGVNLMSLIRWCNRRGLQGMERMYGIPGSVGGAVAGNAGAYGQEIRDVLVEAEIWTPQGTRVYSASQLDFRYRHSILKERRELCLLSCWLRLCGGRSGLQEVSEQTLRTRSDKYPPGIRCPGSFFKNVETRHLQPEILDRIPAGFVQHGKIPAGKLLQAVGACGARIGQAMIAGYHGNLFVNLGGASSGDVLSLAARFADAVHRAFGIRLEPEVLVVGEDLPPESGAPAGGSPAEMGMEG